MAIWREANLILEKHPKYQWGGDATEKNGLDCSGFVYLVFKRAGFAVGRTTSRNMRMGFCGWRGHEVQNESMQVGDLVFWTWRDQPQRPDGHVGIIMKTGDSEAAAHASARRGVVFQRIEGPLIDDISARISPMMR